MLNPSHRNVPKHKSRLWLQTGWLALTLLFWGLTSIDGISMGEVSSVESNSSSAFSSAPPTLAQDTLPATALNMVGDEVTFTAAFSNSPVALFQWQKLSKGETNDIHGATTATLTLTNLQLGDTASYRLKAVNATERKATAYASARPLVVERLPAAVNNLITVVAAQTGWGNSPFTPTWAASTNNSLIAGQAPRSSSGNFSEELSGRNVNALTAGGSLEITSAVVTEREHRGNLTANTNYVTCGNGNRAGSSITYGLAGAKNGYDLTNLTVYGGWLDNGRDQQAYTVYYSTVAAPELFIRMGSVDFHPPNPDNASSATRVTLRPATGALAKNVAVVKLDFTSPMSTNGYGGYSQISLSGTPSATLPPPGSGESTPLLTATNERPNLNRLDLLGSWIWDAQTFDGQTCQFWRTFDIPAGGKIINARLIMTADNEFTLWVDGHELGRGSAWQELFDYDLLPLQMAPGRHVVAIKAFNFARLAGMILGLRIDLADGRFIEIESDHNWKLVPNATKGWEEMTKPQANWPAAIVVAPIGTAPWWDEPAFVNMLPARPPIKTYFWQAAWFQITLCALFLLTIFALAAQLALHQKERWLLQRERARIAMDIHDDIGSRITQLVLNGEDVQEALPEDSTVRRQLGEIWDDARQVLSSIDEILWALNPRLDTLRDFADYICDYAHKFLEPSGIECVFEVDPSMQVAAADLPLRRSLLMAIKETLNNIVKHSGATELRLQIERQHQHLIVVVQDNGQGFDREATRPGRNGLSNLSRRMAELGGSCHISTQPGKGCRIEFRVPLKRPRKFSWFGK